MSQVHPKTSGLCWTRPSKATMMNSELSLDSTIYRLFLLLAPRVEDMIVHIIIRRIDHLLLAGRQSRVLTNELPALSSEVEADKAHI